jgi:hypothetical protein
MLDRQTLIAVIRDQLRRFEEEEYQGLLTKVSSWAQPDPEPEPASVGATTESANSQTKPKQRTDRKIEYVSSKSLTVDFDRAWLANEKDVDNYVAALKKSIMTEIAAGKRVRL